jgi:hypothetical protein
MPLAEVLASLPFILTKVLPLKAAVLLIGLGPSFVILAGIPQRVLIIRAPSICLRGVDFSRVTKLFFLVLEIPLIGTKTRIPRITELLLPFIPC